MRAEKITITLQPEEVVALDDIAGYAAEKRGGPHNRSATIAQLIKQERRRIEKRAERASR